MKMTEKWIHRECAKEDINPEYVLVQPPLSRSHTPCALCGLSHGMQFLYEVEEAPEGISIPIVDETGEVQGLLRVSKDEADIEVVKEVLKAETVEEPAILLRSDPKPELEAMEKKEAETVEEPEKPLEALEKKAESVGAKFVDENGNDVKLDDVLEKTVELTKEKIEEANEKETEIAKLKAELAELEK